VQLGFIGTGKVGSAFGIRLAERGYQVAGCMDIKPQEASRFAAAIHGCRIHNSQQALADASDVVFITVPDDDIQPVASSLQWRPYQTALHCSGANTVGILQEASSAGAQVGVIHPLNTFASLQQSLENLVGGHFTLEAQEPTLSLLARMATELEGDYAVLEAENKSLYHGSGIFSCNYVYTVVAIAVDLFAHFGLGQKEALQALTPLLRGTINNIEHVGLPGCLTGPIARGDITTVEAHLRALQEAAPPLVPLYKALGRRTLPIASAKGTLSEADVQVFAGMFMDE
jgi:predicted short-subunit dehydrogenase-like oxidoreductase (DUF2520 family)